MTCVDGPREARTFFEPVERRRSDRLRTCVRPVDAVDMTAGLDGIRGPGPHQLAGLEAQSLSQV
jgi:hypothetical protein